MLKLKMMLCVMMLLVVVGCTSKSSLSVSAWSHHPPPAWIMQPPPTGRHRWTGLFHLRERLITMQNNWKEPRSILMSRQIELPISMGKLMQLLWAIHTRFQRSINAKVIKPSNPFTNVCWVSVLTTFSAPPQILAASTVFFCPIPETKKWWVMFWCYCCRFVLNSKRLLSTSCNKQASAVASSIFSWCYSRCFLKFAESYV